MTTASSPSRRLDAKLARIRGGQEQPGDFVIADAKDSDMAFGLPHTGPATGPDGSATGRGKTRREFQQDIRDVAGSGAADIMLMSASNAEVLAGEGSLPPEVTIAVRANDTTDVWAYRGATYAEHPSRPFRTADLRRVAGFCDLVLYSMTFNGDLEHDLSSLEGYREFRQEAGEVGIRHFLEVFNPNATSLAAADVPAFVNDSIARSLAGVTAAERPEFLKMAFNGVDAMAELVGYDDSLVVGILGGSSGTTRDTFELLRQGQGAGARVALFGRKIQRAESQVTLVQHMRSVVDGRLEPDAAVRSYHEALAGLGLTPARSLEQDLALTDPVLMS